MLWAYACLICGKLSILRIGLYRILDKESQNIGTMLIVYYNKNCLNNLA